MKYRKKPVVIEAFQMTKERRVDNLDWPNWLNEAWNKPFTEKGAVGCEGEPPYGPESQLLIQTLEGVHLVEWLDFIIQGAAGELSSCKPDIFHATYEKVE